MIEFATPTQEYQAASESLRFHDVSPEFSAVAYHATQEQYLPSIAEQGLVESGPGDRYRNNFLWLDSFRPSDISVTFQHSVFAQIEGGHLIDVSGIYNSSAYRLNNWGDPGDRSAVEMLAVAVNPKTTYVVSLDDTEYARNSGKAEDAQDVWRKAMTLESFYELYKQDVAFDFENRQYGDPDDTSYTGLVEENNVYWRLKDESKKDPASGVPLIYGNPELLVPVDEDGFVPPNRLEHHASSTTNRIFTKKEAEDYKIAQKEEFKRNQRQQLIAKGLGKIAA